MVVMDLVTTNTTTFLPSAHLLEFNFYIPEQLSDL